jgi:hypothetical protein
MFQKKVILPGILLVASLVLLVLNLTTPEGKINILGAISNILLILGMVLVIIDNRKKPNNRS